MALKDWKKVKGNDTWIHQKYYSRRIVITRLENDFYKYIIYIPNTVGDYLNTGNSSIHKYFKTKSEAMRFAKAYMRKK